MKCPYCGNLEDKVIDSRIVKNGEAIRRRRECISCKNRFTTYEGLEPHFLVVIKKNGTRENFSREKLLNGIKIACQKRPISYEKLNSIVDRIVYELSSLGEVEIDSRKIGDLVMDELKKIDKIAYVRFASVYKEFKDADDFINVVNKVKEN